MLLACVGAYGNARLIQCPNLQDCVGPRPGAGAEPLESVVDDGQVRIEAAQLIDHRFPQRLGVRRQHPFIGPKSLRLIKVADSVEKCSSKIIQSLLPCHPCQDLLFLQCISLIFEGTS